jgi:hypothetical protein
MFQFLFLLPFYIIFASELESVYRTSTLSFAPGPTAVSLAAAQELGPSPADHGGSALDPASSFFPPSSASQVAVCSTPSPSAAHPAHRSGRLTRAVRGARAHGDDDGVRAAQVGGGFQGLQLRVYVGAGRLPQPPSSPSRR